MMRTCRIGQVAVLAALLLAGCASAPPASAPINVPVAVGCLGNVPVRPVSLYGKGEWPGDKAAAQAALADANAWEQYATGLEAAQAGCSQRSHVLTLPAAAAEPAPPAPGK
jgi:hypothetical protein